jgi:hypothetical protein
VLSAHWHLAAGTSKHAPGFAGRATSQRFKEYVEAESGQPLVDFSDRFIVEGEGGGE